MVTILRMITQSDSHYVACRLIGDAKFFAFSFLINKSHFTIAHATQSLKVSAVVIYAMELLARRGFILYILYEIRYVSRKNILNVATHFCVNNAE